MPESGKDDVLDCKKSTSDRLSSVKCMQRNRTQHTELAADTTSSYYEGLYVG